MRKCGIWVSALFGLLIWVLMPGSGVAASGYMTSFSLGPYIGMINHELNKISVTVPTCTDRTSIVPIFTFDGDSSDKPSGVPTDFSVSPVTITISYTNSNGSGSMHYDVFVEQDANSNSKEITAFSLAGIPATVAGNTIMMTVPHNTRLKGAIPDFILYSGCSITPAADQAQDFSCPVQYTVVDSNGKSKEYNVNIIVEPAPIVLGDVEIAGMGDYYMPSVQMPAVPTPTPKPWVEPIRPSALQRTASLRGDVDSAGHLTLAITEDAAGGAIGKVRGAARELDRLSSEQEIVFQYTRKQNLTSFSVQLEREAIVRLIDANMMHVGLSTPILSLSLDRDALEALHAIGETVSFTITPAVLDDETLIPKPGYSIALHTEDGKELPITSLGKGLVTVDIPYTPLDGEDLRALCAIVMDEGGTLQAIPSSYYAGTSVHATLDQIGLVGIGYRNTGRR